MKMQFLSSKGTKAILFVEPVAMLCWTGLFYTYCFRVRSALGRWPVPFDSVADPLDRGYHDALVEGLMVLILITFVPWAVWLIYRLFWTKDLPRDRTVGIAVFVWVAFLANLLINPAGLVEWYFD
jgi:hypothetical protein